MDYVKFSSLHKAVVVHLHNLPTAGGSMDTGMVIVIFCIDIIAYK